MSSSRMMVVIDSVSSDCSLFSFPVIHLPTRPVPGRNDDAILKCSFVRVSRISPAVGLAGGFLSIIERQSPKTGFRGPDAVCANSLSHIVDFFSDRAYHRDSWSVP